VIQSETTVSMGRTFWWLATGGDGENYSSAILIQDGRRRRLARDDGADFGGYKARPQSDGIWDERFGSWRRRSWSK
jgi:hypothetical protein